MSRSVLRVSDQRRERFPEVCVLSGEPTSHAVRSTAVTWSGPRWLLGVPGFAPVVGLLPRHDREPIALPVSPRVWRMWQRRNAVAIIGVVVGLLWMLVGVIVASGAAIAAGATLALLAGAYRTRTVVNYWMTCRLDAGAGTIIVEPTHRIFDDAAKRLLISSI